MTTYILISFACWKRKVVWTPFTFPSSAFSIAFIWSMRWSQMIHETLTSSHDMCISQTRQDSHHLLSFSHCRSQRMVNISEVVTYCSARRAYFTRWSNASTSFVRPYRWRLTTTRESKLCLWAKCHFLCLSLQITVPLDLLSSLATHLLWIQCVKSFIFKLDSAEIRLAPR